MAAEQLHDPRQWPTVQVGAAALIQAAQAFVPIQER
jgi:hypothetical protein